MEKKLIEEIQLNLKEQGYTIVENFFDVNEISYISNLVNLLNKKFGEEGGGSTRVMNLITLNHKFLEIILSEKINDLVKIFLNNDYIYSCFQSNTLYPNSGKVWFHIDHPYQYLNNHYTQTKSHPTFPERRWFPNRLFCPTY